MAEDQKPSLLIVDDDPLITDTLSYALGKDFEVRVSDSRRHAVSLLRQLDAAPQLGAAEFVAKPCDPETLKKILLHALQFRAAEISGEDIAGTDPLIGRSPALRHVKNQHN